MKLSIYKLIFKKQNVYQTGHDVVVEFLFLFFFFGSRLHANAVNIKQTRIEFLDHKII